MPRTPSTTDIRVALLGRFSVVLNGETILDGAPHKAQELLAYLLIYRGKSHPREVLADVLWGDCGSPHARKYLRQALWQLHAGLVAAGRGRASRLIHQEPGWVELDLDRGIWVDTITFEETFNSVRGKCPLSHAEVKRVVEAIQFYRGELLEGSSQKWCLYERERFREMYLTLLDKLVHYCELSGQYEAGVAFGTLALRCDRARERTHRSLMSLFYLSGDRTAALRQYERCVQALLEDLDVEPSQESVELYRAIRTDRARAERPEPAHGSPLFVMTPAQPSHPNERSLAPRKLRP